MVEIKYDYFRFNLETNINFEVLYVYPLAGHSEIQWNIIHNSSSDCEEVSKERKILFRNTLEINYVYVSQDVHVFFMDHGNEINEIGPSFD